MDRNRFISLLRQGILLGDGATGTELTRRGMPVGACPELWAAEHPDAAQSLMADYARAGSQFLTTPTFGGSAIKLARFGLADRTEELNATLAKLTRQAAPEGVLVAANIGPSGELLQPMGTLGLDEMTEGFRRQAAGLLQGNPDFFLLETFMDPAEARAAVLAIRELCDLPFVVSCTLQNGRTLTGATPEAIAVLFTALGAAAVGCNCSGGPDTLRDAIAAMARHTNLPLFAKPNAGMPQVVNGRTVFDMKKDAFAEGMGRLIEAGATLVGGCCGTSPDYIATLRQTLDGLSPARREPVDTLFLCSPRRVAAVDKTGPLCVVGAGIHPSGADDLTEDLKGCHADVAVERAMDQMAAGVRALAVNVAAPGVDEARAMDAVVNELSVAVPLPLFISSADPDVLEAGLRPICGRSALGPVALGDDTDTKLASAHKYGAVAVLVPMENGQMPIDCAERVALAEQLLARAAAHGLDRQSLLIDVGDDSPVAVDFTREMTQRGWHTIAGAAGQAWVQSTLSTDRLAELAAAGLGAVLLHPTDEAMEAAEACEAIRGGNAG